MTSRDTDIARLRQALDSQNRHERAEAAIELGRAGDNKALPALEKMAEEADDLVAIAALYASACLTGAPRGIDRMAAALASEDEETMQLAVHALCELGDNAVPELERSLTASSPVKLQIVRVLSNIGVGPARDALARASASEDTTVAHAARAALAADP